MIWLISMSAFSPFPTMFKQRLTLKVVKSSDSVKVSLP